MLNNRRRVVALATAAAAVAFLATAPSAMADRVPVNASGNTTIQLGGPAIKALQTNGCGMLAAVATGNGTVTTTGAGKIKIVLPITGLVVQDDSGALRIAHSGSGVDLSNACYDIRLTNFYIQDFGEPGQSTTFDVLAKTQSADDSGRELVFQLDLTNANFTDTGHALKVRSANLLLAAEGADEFNELANGTDTGPFTEGQQVGKARTSIRIQYA